MGRDKQQLSFIHMTNGLGNEEKVARTENDEQASIIRTSFGALFTLLEAFLVVVQAFGCQH